MEQTGTKQCREVNFDKITSQVPSRKGRTSIFVLDWSIVWSSEFNRTLFGDTCTCKLYKPLNSFLTYKFNIKCTGALVD